MRHRMAQNELACVVTAGADRGPGVERRELVLIEAVGLATATRNAGYVEQIECCRFISSIPHPYIGVDILRCAVATARCVRKHIFEVWNCGDGSEGIAAIGVHQFRHDSSGGKIVHTGFLVDQIERLGNIELLQQVTPESAYIVSFEEK